MQVKWKNGEEDSKKFLISKGLLLIPKFPTASESHLHNHSS